MENRSAEKLMDFKVSTSKDDDKISGGDALTGNTRSHPEHDVKP